MKCELRRKDAMHPHKHIARTMNFLFHHSHPHSYNLFMWTGKGFAAKAAKAAHPPPTIRHDTIFFIFWEFHPRKWVFLDFICNKLWILLSAKMQGTAGFQGDCSTSRILSASDVGLVHSLSRSQYIFIWKSSADLLSLNRGNLIFNQFLSGFRSLWRIWWTQSSSLNDAVRGLWLASLRCRETGYYRFFFFV